MRAIFVTTLSKMSSTFFEITTQGPGFYEFTDKVRAWCQSLGSGALVLMVQHTSASLLVQENADPDVQSDLLAFLNALVPRSDDPRMSYLRHTLEGPDDMPAHIKAAFMPVSLTIPVVAGRACLGTWQGIYLVEHRDGGFRRRVAASFLGGE